jgi:nicotinamide-nucleotide amidase
MSVTLENLATELGQQLVSKKLKIVTAESCTGGGLAYWITAISGSSDWFDRGFITYSNEAKVQMLGVSLDSIERHGAVSEQVAKEMAEKSLAKSIAGVSVAITGIAGPLGGSPNKPVGTVWIGIAEKSKQTTAYQYVFAGDRASVRLQAIQEAFKLLLSITG